MRRTSYAAAIVEALRISLAEDPGVNLIGSYVLGLGPERALMDSIRAEFADRIYNPPTSEAALACIGAGAAMAGARPFVDIGTASFAYVAWSPLVNEAAVAHYMSNGKVRVPVVYHMLHGLRGGGAAQHSQSPQAMLWNAPGLEIVVPASPYDVKGLLRSAIRSNNPTVFIDHARLMNIEGDVPEGDYVIPFGCADIKRPGRDATVIATSFVVQAAL
ncbi:MAG: alpha-ketoacid dehydrogenase subunit beta, partial [Hyphomicrobiales bacterium]|nr:alpha-ketoacid dehydrogenase subunit beta [Hyphomicrobiales bacterium]